MTNRVPKYVERERCRRDWLRGVWAYAMGRRAEEHPEYGRAMKGIKSRISNLRSQISNRKSGNGRSGRDGLDGRDGRNGRGEADERWKWTREAVRVWSDVDAVLDGCWFDIEAARDAASFFPRVLKHYQGPLAGQPFELMDWLEYDVTYPLFGWRRPDGTRRFRRGHIEIPKKNNKTTFATGVACYLLVADGEAGPEVYSAGVDREQAGRVFTTMQAMIEQSPGLKRRCRIIEHTHRILYPASRGLFRVLSSRDDSAEGLNISGCVIDELHAHRNARLFGALRGGGKARPQPLFLAITTSGIYNPASIGWEQHEYARGVMEGSLRDWSMFAYVAGAEVGTGSGGWDRWALDADTLPRFEDGDVDWTSPAVHRRANPAWNVIVSAESLREECLEAEAGVLARGDFLRRGLNIWIQSRRRWIDASLWASRGIEWSAAAAAVAGRRCYGGLDLSDTKDLTALAYWFPRVEGMDGMDEVDVVLTWFWLPRENLGALEKASRAPYAEWAREGRLRLTEGTRVDYQAVRRFISESRELYDVQEIAFDPWNASSVITDLMEDHGEDFMVQHRQGDVSMNAPVMEFERMVAEGTMRHARNPIMDWMMGHATLREGPTGLVKLLRGDAGVRMKIDGPIAAVMGLSRAMVHREEPSGPIGFWTLDDLPAPETAGER